jgi:hypothetical protein
VIDDVHGDGGSRYLSAQLLAATELMAASQRMAWQLFGAFCVTNALLLIALFASGEIPVPLVGVVVSGAGLVLSAVSWLLVRQAADLTHTYAALIGRIEQRLQVRNGLGVGGAATEAGIGGLIAAGALGAGILWLIALALFAYAGLTGMTEAPATF